MSGTVYIDISGSRHQDTAAPVDRVSLYQQSGPPGRAVVSTNGGPRRGPRGVIRNASAGLNNPGLSLPPVPPRPSGRGRRRALIRQQRSNPLLCRGQAIESLPAIGVRLVETV